uniref:NADH dehydrogenase subunit 6 n=1 Tax=Calyptra minuticornis TaxID=1137967 RepID=UPI001FAF1F78|nr:NADH dehydrogenase subunit 6 [Calyptra minuticornis]UNP54622.1 NADH dehydrogenase subunit 6 [Calyptra minuticornis]
MTKMFLSFMIMLISLFMLFMNNPLSMGLMILMQTLLISLLSGMLIKTYWFSYILFLIFLGGLLVLFIYVSSIASNELFKTSFNLKIIFLFIFMIFIMIQIIYFNNLFWMNLSMNSDMNNFFNFNLMINNENKINLNKLYNNQTFMIMLMLIIYLFITLISVVKITNIFYGPLRSNF